MNVAVGIDFGNQFYKVAVAHRGGVDVIMNEVSQRSTPNMVSFVDGERLFGDMAKMQHVRNINNSVYNIKNLLAHQWKYSANEELPFDIYKKLNNLYVLGQSDENSIVGIIVSIFNRIKLQVRDYLDLKEDNLEKIKFDLVVSVPLYWTQFERNMILDATKIANLNCIEIINDTTAAALEYGFYRHQKRDSEENANNVMFVDMGNSDTTISIVRFTNDGLKVVGGAYDCNLSGSEFDNVLLNHFAERFYNKYNINILDNKKSKLKLLNECEKLKKVLNTIPEYNINVEYIIDELDLQDKITELEFCELCQELLDRLEKIVNDVLLQSNMTNEDINGIEILGGSTRLKMVKQKLSEILGKNCSNTLNCEEAVCKGGALRCAMLSSYFKTKDYTIKDSVCHEIDILHGNDNLTLYKYRSNTPAFYKILFNTNSYKLKIVYPKIPFSVNDTVGTLDFDFEDNRKLVDKLMKNDDCILKIKVFFKLSLDHLIQIKNVELLKKYKKSNKKENNEENNEDKKEENNEENKEETYIFKYKFEEEKLDEQQMEFYRKLEYCLVERDQKYNQIKELKNDLEGLIFDVKNNTETLKEFGNDEEVNNLVKINNQTENWLDEYEYEENNNIDEKIRIYKDKIGKIMEIKKVIYNRKDRYFKMLNLVKSTKDYKKYIPNIENLQEDYLSKINEFRSYIDNLEIKLESLPKNKDLDFTEEDIMKRIEEINNIISLIYKAEHEYNEQEIEQNLDEIGLD